MPDFTEDLTPLPSGKAVPGELRGAVSAGVEAGCLLLTAADGVYLLVGGDQTVPAPGRTVVVTGVVEPHLMTTCQQGTPFRVASVRPA